ncbi:MAG: hypothetical protein JJE22_13785 [Bacteroidia bacterium]|nr:hypothetical protein [Bacteroidia bacterium]
MKKIKVAVNEYGTSLGIFSSLNSLGQVAGVVIGGIIMIWSDHFAYWVVAVILIVVAYLLLPKRKLLIQKS